LIRQEAEYAHLFFRCTAPRELFRPAGTLLLITQGQGLEFLLVVQDIGFGQRMVAKKTGVLKMWLFAVPKGQVPHF
jgi:hypothetical protein